MRVVTRSVTVTNGGLDVTLEREDNITWAVLRQGHQSILLTLRDLANAGDLVSAAQETIIDAEMNSTRRPSWENFQLPKF